MSSLSKLAGRTFFFKMYMYSKLARTVIFIRTVTVLFNSRLITCMLNLIPKCFGVDLLIR